MSSVSHLPIYQLDAFTQTRFKGNPAAVIPLDKWLPDDLLQAIAGENNLSETAFFVAKGDGFHLRWFTPTHEVALCGHATLATAEVIFANLKHHLAQVHFHTQSGLLTVGRLADGRLEMDFPAQPVTPVLLSDTEQEHLNAGLGLSCGATFAHEDLLVRCPDEASVRAIKPDPKALAELPYRGIIATAPGTECDFVSRFFAPAVGVDEDPVTGSAHTKLTPYWAEQLGKNLLSARQVSARGGELECELQASRVLLRGYAVQYLEGRIAL
ncbi:PhzF family phenazine biosynthesis protein [Simiduia sp. 21SJ11W-1]|uniref:PhzF family phenazine biosynthesis protein n=1 Tax=Simiduia sp. 21SJ11W-1 TaxID=2909669 RepID=UPI0020A06DE9|nr:PhzF family phenazine biosynthesis protein [Simiduia sp. 21SJ11W-1]UTA48128.1 PhzF family phenazine biosynthesis protein [Simiduia sp. 21SJ11W-1]